MNVKYILRVWGLFVLFSAILFFPFVLPLIQGAEGVSFPSPFIFWGILAYGFMAYDVILGARLAFFEKILKSNNISKKRIHAEKFSF